MCVYEVNQDIYIIYMNIIINKKNTWYVLRKLRYMSVIVTHANEKEQDREPGERKTDQ